MSETAEQPLNTAIEAIIRRGLRLAAARKLGADDDLAELGLDSLALIEVMLRLQQEFNVTLPPALMVPETFRSLRSVQSVIEQLLAA